MKNLLLSFFSFVALSGTSLAATCLHVDYTCPEDNNLTIGQTLGRVCLALKEAEMIDDETPLHYSITKNTQNHMKFLSSLKTSLNECPAYNRHGKVIGYFDYPMTERSFKGQISAFEIAQKIQLEQRFVIGTLD